MNTIKNILIIDDDKSSLDVVNNLSSKLGYNIYYTQATNQAFDKLKKNDISIVFVAMNEAAINGISIIEKIKKSYPDISIVALTENCNMQKVIDYVRAGAKDCLNKPFSTEEIKEVIERINQFTEVQIQLKKTELKYKHTQSELKENLPVEIVGVSPGIKEVFNMVAKVAATDATSVLITGESGTGKEVIARSIHALSSRSNNFFHCVNCSAIPESLFESEFFGYKKGAFTGAAESTSGWFEVSHHGTLFLDEVAELPPGLQAKFLRVLDDKMISRIGTKKSISLDLRIITATNKNLEQLVKEKKFREDLYHRLNTFVIEIPPLRERQEDIPELVNYFVKYFSKNHGKNITKIQEDIYHYLAQYPFPGNVRELKNMIERAMIICESDVLQVKDFSLPVEKTKRNTLLKQYDITTEELDLEKLEYKAIMKALELSKFNKSKAAEMLNITRQSLQRKIKKHGIKK